MIPLYIVLYLVVGLIVKWLMQRWEGEEYSDGRNLMFLIWPFIIALILTLGPLFYVDNWVSRNGPPKIYTRIRKFFRGF